MAFAAAERPSLLEAMLSMPLKKMGVRSFEGPMGCSGVAVLVDQGPYALLIVNTSRDENLKIVGERDQPPIEHPVRRTGKREAIADDVGSTLFDWPDMRRIDFGATAAVDQPQPHYRTPLAIGPQDRSVHRVKSTGFITKTHRSEVFLWRRPFGSWRSTWRSQGGGT